MKNLLFAPLCVLAITATSFGSIAQAQDDKKPGKMKPAPVIVRFNAHAMGANDFQIRRSKDRSIETTIKNKGIDVAFTEWMQRDHPYLFASECIKETGGIANEFKSTTHMVDFDNLLSKRPDLRMQADKYGHDVAFAEWLRTEHPDLYLQHFGIKAPKNRKK